jgi:hypothetical protein
MLRGTQPGAQAASTKPSRVAPRRPYELTHRDQIAGAPGGGGRGGAGFLSFYAQYFAWAPGGYRENPYESEAFHVGDGSEALPEPRRNFGDAIASPFALSLFLLPELLMPPPAR